MIKHAMLATFCFTKKQMVLDSLADSFIKLVHKSKFSAEKEINKGILKEVQKVSGKFDILFSLSDILLIIQTELLRSVPPIEMRKLKKNNKFF